MPRPDAIDIGAAFERALAAPKGVRIVCASRSVALRLRQRMNYWRVTDRDGRENRQSPYAHLRIRLPPKGKPGEAILYIEPRQAEDLTIEEIT